MSPSLEIQSANRCLHSLRAQFETTSRLIASLLNEQLVEATPCVCPGLTKSQYDNKSIHGLQLRGFNGRGRNDRSIWIALGNSDLCLDMNQLSQNCYHPKDFALPILAISSTLELEKHYPMPKPDKIMEFCRPFLAVQDIDDISWEKLVYELENSASNQCPYPVNPLYLEC